VSGQVGSNQGGEWQGRTIKDQIKPIIKKLKPRERMNPYYFIMALARVNMFHGDLHKFQSRPKRNVACNCEDYNFDGDCQHSCFFDVMYFGNYPQNEVQKAGDNWDNIAKPVVEILRVNKDIMFV
jgi:hypothetical protein